jgi:bifunctional DNA-binding transcriptional regulator/antitoxin component of YhaV-PrlF toxin-antitoxin module
VTSKYQTVVPKALRNQLKISPGTVLDWTAEGDTLRVVKLIPTDDPSSQRKTCRGMELAAALRKFEQLTTAKDRRKMAEHIDEVRQRMNREHLH